MGVLRIRALPFGVFRGPLIFGSSYLGAIGAMAVLGVLGSRRSPVEGVPKYPVVEGSHN